MPAKGFAHEGENPQENPVCLVFLVFLVYLVYGQILEEDNFFI